MKQGLLKSSESALLTCMSLQSDESLLILCDEQKKEIGEALYTAGRKITTDVLLVMMPPAEINGQEPPGRVARLMAEFNVVICPTSKSLTHTNARRNACKKGARVATMPGITAEIMIRTMKADYNMIADRTLKVTKILDKGDLIKITTPAGTNLTMPVKGICSIASTGLIRKPGQGGNLPSGEAFMMPEEGKSNGLLVIDASIASIGKITGNPVKVTIRNGFAVKFGGGRSAGQLEKLLGKFGKAGRNIAEIGVGTNHQARITGQILEDEKVLGTIHVAFGNNISMGGTCDAGIHIDGVVLKPTVWVDDRKILNNGKLLI